MNKKFVVRFVASLVTTFVIATAAILMAGTLYFGWQTPQEFGPAFFWVGISVVVFIYAITPVDPVFRHFSPAQMRYVRYVKGQTSHETMAKDKTSFVRDSTDYYLFMVGIFGLMAGVAWLLHQWPW